MTTFNYEIFAIRRGRHVFLGMISTDTLERMVQAVAETLNCRPSDWKIVAKDCYRRLDDIVMEKRAVAVGC